MSEQRKKLQKKRARKKAVKKKLIEKRLENRKELKFQQIRNDAFEKEFVKKQNLNLSSEEIKKRLEKNIKIIEALEEEYAHTSEANQETINHVKEQLAIQQAILNGAKEENKEEKEENSD